MNNLSFEDWYFEDWYDTQNGYYRASAYDAHGNFMGFVKQHYTETIVRWLDTGEPVGYDLEKKQE